MYRYNLGIKFEEVAKKYSKNVALKFSQTNTVTYNDLNQNANQLARYLLDLGVKQKDVICISGNKKTSTFACMLACLKIGAIYSIFDPESPAERLRKIFKVCMPRILFMEAELIKPLQEIIEQLKYHRHK